MLKVIKNKKILIVSLVGIGLFLRLGFGAETAFAAKTTTFTNASSSYRYALCRSEKYWTAGDDQCVYGSSIGAFASAISILTNNKKGHTPTNIAEVAYKNKYWNLKGTPPSDLIKKLANYYGLKYAYRTGKSSETLTGVVKVIANGGVVIARSKSDTKPFDGDQGQPNYIVIYAARSDGYFKVSSPTYCRYLNKFCGDWLHYKELRSALGSEVRFDALGTKIATDLAGGFSPVTPTSGTGGSSGSSGRITDIESRMKKYYMSQGDYGGVKFSSGTLKSDGCGVVSFSMAISVLYNRKMSPKYAVTLTGKYRTASSTPMDHFNVMVSNLKKAGEKAGSSLVKDLHISTMTASKSAVDKALDQGKVVFIGCKGGVPCGTNSNPTKGHYMAIVGKTSNGDWVVANSYHRNPYKTKFTYSSQAVWNTYKGGGRIRVMWRG
ncbi:C39 family peptidase [Candidatus Saccharibacteria bacterium]|nr:C39 family peptidase [Candidatus Saccharibacteria bacterium]